MANSREVLKQKYREVLKQKYLDMVVDYKTHLENKEEPKLKALHNQLSDIENWLNDRIFFPTQQQDEDFFTQLISSDQPKETIKQDIYAQLNSSNNPEETIKQVINDVRANLVVSDSSIIDPSDEDEEKIEEEEEEEKEEQEEEEKEEEKEKIVKVTNLESDADSPLDSPLLAKVKQYKKILAERDLKNSKELKKLHSQLSDIEKYLEGSRNLTPQDEALYDQLTFEKETAEEVINEIITEVEKHIKVRNPSVSKSIQNLRESYLPNIEKAIQEYRPIVNSSESEDDDLFVRDPLFCKLIDIKNRLQGANKRYIGFASKASGILPTELTEAELENTVKKYLAEAQDKIQKAVQEKMASILEKAERANKENTEIREATKEKLQNIKAQAIKFYTVIQKDYPFLPTDPTQLESEFTKLTNEQRTNVLQNKKLMQLYTLLNGVNKLLAQLDQNSVIDQSTTKEIESLEHSVQSLNENENDLDNNNVPSASTTTSNASATMMEISQEELTFFMEELDELEEKVNVRQKELLKQSNNNNTSIPNIDNLIFEGNGLLTNIQSLQENTKKISIDLDNNNDNENIKTQLEKYRKLLEEYKQQFQVYLAKVNPSEASEAKETKEEKEQSSIEKPSELSEQKSSIAPYQYRMNEGLVNYLDPHLDRYATKIKLIENIASSLHNQRSSEDAKREIQYWEKECREMKGQLTAYRDHLSKLKSEIGYSNLTKDQKKNLTELPTYLESLDKLLVNLAKTEISNKIYASRAPVYQDASTDKDLTEIFARYNKPYISAEDPIGELSGGSAASDLKANVRVFVTEFRYKEKPNPDKKGEKLTPVTNMLTVQKITNGSLTSSFYAAGLPPKLEWQKLPDQNNKKVKMPDSRALDWAKEQIENHLANMANKSDPIRLLGNRMDEQLVFAIMLQADYMNKFNQQHSKNPIHIINSTGKDIVITSQHLDALDKYNEKTGNIALMRDDSSEFFETIQQFKVTESQNETDKPGLGEGKDEAKPESGSESEPKSESEFESESPSDEKLESEPIKKETNVEESSEASTEESLFDDPNPNDIELKEIITSKPENKSKPELAKAATNPIVEESKNLEEESNNLEEENDHETPLILRKRASSTLQINNGLQASSSKSNSATKPKVTATDTTTDNTKEGVTQWKRGKITEDSATDNQKWERTTPTRK